MRPCFLGRSFHRTRHQLRGTVDPEKPFFVEVECYDQISLGTLAIVDELLDLQLKISRVALEILVQISLGTTTVSDELCISKFLIRDLPKHHVPLETKTPPARAVNSRVGGKLPQLNGSM